MKQLVAAVVVVVLAVAACASPTPSRLLAPSPSPSPPVATPTPVSLAMDATGLGPCTEPWYMTCNYGIRVEGPGGYDHRGTFAWEARPQAGSVKPGRAGPVASTGVWGDVPAKLPPGVWTISFRRWYGSDMVSFEPVPGGTPRPTEEDPFTAGCSTRLDTSGVASIALHVAFRGSACTIATPIAGGH